MADVMDIPKGFKQTEVGVIPKDWEVKKLDEIATVKTGPFGSALHEKDYVQDGTPIITVEHLGEQGITNENLPMVSDLDKTRLNGYLLRAGDIVFSRVGSVDRNSLIRNREHGWLFSGRLLRIRLTESNTLSNYLSYYFHQETTKQRIRSVAVGQTMASLNTKIMKGISAALPPTKAEQTAIATVLTDADTLIAQLEQLIAKKRAIKQGALQELLKPKEGWKIKNLGEECELITKGTTPTSIGRIFQKNGINFVKIESVSKNGKIIKDSLASIDDYTNNLLKRSQLKIGDILFSIAGALGRVAIVSDNILPANTNQALAIIRLKKDTTICLKYLFYSLNSIKIQNYISAITVQGAQANLSLHDINNLPIYYPIETEQTRIAWILSDMDAEIETLEKKLEKYKRIKQGMMQVLLTGRIRLV